MLIEQPEFTGHTPPASIDFCWHVGIIDADDLVFTRVKSSVLGQATRGRPTFRHRQKHVRMYALDEDQPR